MIAQEKEDPKIKRLSAGITGGVNYSKYLSDSAEYSYGTRYAIGAFAKYRIIERLNLKTSVMYSVKGSNSMSPNFKLVNSYLDVNVLPEFKLVDGLFIQAGACYSYGLFSRTLTNAGSVNASKLNSKLGNETSGIVGIELRLRKNVNLAFNYYIPLSSPQTNNFQVTINYTLFHKEKVKKGLSRERRENAKQKIKDLKEGTLLVRLKTSEPQINALIKKGKTEKAAKVKKEQEEENKKIMKAFKDEFNFTKAVFFYSNHSLYVRKKMFNHIFLDSNLSINDSITIDSSKPIFIADFTQIEQDTTTFFDLYTYQKDENCNWQKSRLNYGGPDFGFDAMIIRDKNFVQLSEPFPYYSRFIFKSFKECPIEAPFLYPLLPFQNWTYAQTVRSMNDKLVKFYKRKGK